MMTYRVQIIFSTLALVASACDGDEASDSIPTFDESRAGVLVECEDGSFDPEQINATLADYPELAEALNITDVLLTIDA